MPKYDDSAFEELRTQTQKNTEAIGELTSMNAVQNEQIKTLFNTTKSQGDTQKALVNRLVMSIVGVLIIVVLALIFGALGPQGFKAVTSAAPSFAPSEAR